MGRLAALREGLCGFASCSPTCARGCIAYVEGEQSDTTEAVFPHLFGSGEHEAVGALVTEWQAEARDAEVELLPE